MRDKNVGDWPVTWPGLGGLSVATLSDARSGRACLVVGLVPDLLPPSAGLLAAQGEDDGRAGLGPVHAGEFEALPALQPGFTGTEADEHAQRTEPGVAKIGSLGPLLSRAPGRAASRMFTPSPYSPRRGADGPHREPLTVAL